MNIMLLAQKPIGTWTFDEMCRVDMPPACVVTNCEIDRWTWWNDCELWRKANYRKIPKINNARRNEGRIRDAIETLEVDCLLSVQHPWILPLDILCSVESAYNVHMAPLPQYPGKECARRALEDKAQEFGWTIHRMYEEVDSDRSVVSHGGVPIYQHDSVDTLYARTEEAVQHGVRDLIRDLVTVGAYA